MENGDMEGAEKVLGSIKFPGLLYKPIRSVYYTLKGNVAMMKQDFDGAEKNDEERSRPRHADERSRRSQHVANGNAPHAKK